MRLSLRNARVWGPVAGIFILAVVLRLAVAAVAVGLATPAAAEPASDSRIHAALVESLLQGRGFSRDGEPTASTPPLYVLFLAGLYRLMGSPAAVRIVQALLGGLSCLLLYAFASGVFDRRTGLAAAAMLAVFPHAVYLSSLHLTENLLMVFLTGALWLSHLAAVHPRPVTLAGLGGLLGLSALTRAAFSAFLPLMLVWAAGTWGISRHQAFRASGTVLATAVVTVSPWLLRNYVELGTLVPVQGNVGMVFWAANNPHADGGVVWPTRETWQPGPPPDDGHYGWHALTPAQENRLYVKTSLAWIRANPGKYARLVGRKLERLYGFSKAENGHPLSVPLAARMAYGGVLAAAAAGVVPSLNRWRQLLLALLLAAFTNLTAVVPRCWPCWRRSAWYGSRPLRFTW